MVKYMNYKKDMLVFGGYGLILLAFMYFAWQIVPMGEGLIQIFYMIAMTSVWISVGCFIMVLWNKCRMLFKNFSTSIKKNDEE